MPSRASPGPGGEAAESHQFVNVERELHPLRRRRPPPRARDRAGALRASSGHRPRLTFVPHLLPLDQGLLASCYAASRASRSTPTRCARSSGALRGRAVRRAGRRRRRECATSATPTSAGSTSTVTGAGAGDRLRGDRQPVEGRLGTGGPEPQPDARPARDRGAGSEHRGRQLLSLPLGVGARTGSRSSTSARAGAGIPRRRCRLRPQGRRSHRRRPPGLRLRGGRLGAAADPQRGRRGPGAGLPRRVRPVARSAARWSTPATPTPPPERRGYRDARAMRDAAAEALGPRAAAGRGRGDRDDRRAAADRRGAGRDRRARPTRLSERGGR